MFKRFEQSPDDRATFRMASKLALSGHAVSGYQFHRETKPYCDEPVKICRSTKAGGITKAVEVSFYAPCRKCEKCLKFRRLQWRERALNEIILSRRTWALTLTFSPHHLAGIIFESHRDNVTLERAAYGHVQKYLKRLRKVRTVGNAPLRFRYLAVFELGGRTGRPHYHLLIHEMNGPVTKRVLEDRWRSFSAPRLVAQDDAIDMRRKASYITSYATKSFDVKPRASAGYGKQSPTGD